MNEDRRYRSDDPMDLDFTWQTALRAAHRRIDELFSQMADNTARVALVEHELKEMSDSLKSIAADIHVISGLKEQITGGARLIMWLGGLAVALATGWDSVINTLKGLLK
jgi:hypothetical protein